MSNVNVAVARARGGRRGRQQRRAGRWRGGSRACAAAGLVMPLADWFMAENDAHDVLWLIGLSWALQESLGRYDEAPLLGAAAALLAILLCAQALRRLLDRRLTAGAAGQHDIIHVDAPRALSACRPCRKIHSCLLRTQLRAGPALDSQPAGIIEPKQLVVEIDEQRLADGRRRVQVGRLGISSSSDPRSSSSAADIIPLGWLSAATEDHTAILCELPHGEAASAWIWRGLLALQYAHASAAVDAFDRAWEQHRWVSASI